MTACCVYSSNVCNVCDVRHVQRVQRVRRVRRLTARYPRPWQTLVAFMKLANTIKRGDIIGVKGLPGKTKVRRHPAPPRLGVCCCS